MPNPKDTKEYAWCAHCGFEKASHNPVDNKCPEGIERFVYCPYHNVAHYPGCHKVHIECANKIIDEARLLITEAAMLRNSERMNTGPENEWLESLGVEE